MKTIERKSMPKIIAKTGYNRNMDRNILYGPSALGGGGFIPLHVKQGSELIRHMLKHWRSKDKTSTACIL